MRVIAAMLLSMSLAASPLLANGVKDAGKEESPAKAVAEKPKGEPQALPESRTPAEAPQRRVVSLCCR